MTYLICRHGQRITVKRSDRDLDFGEVLAQRDTLPAAKDAAQHFRMVAFPKQQPQSQPDLFDKEDK